MVERVDKAARRKQLLDELAALENGLTSCWDRLPRAWAGRPIDWDFRPMIWFNGQYLRLPEDEKGLPELARETMRRFYTRGRPAGGRGGRFQGAGRVLHRRPAGGIRPPRQQPHRGAGAGLRHRWPHHRGPRSSRLTASNLTRARLHWWRFKALMSNLPEETQLAKIIGFRTADLAQFQGAERERRAELKERFALPAASAERRRSHCHPARPQRSLCGPLPALTAPRFSAPCAADLCRSGPSRRPARRVSGSNAKTPPVSGK